MTIPAQNDVQIIPDMRIPLPCGTELSARVWMPDTQSNGPLPAIIEYLPYRKTDGTAARDHGMHLHFSRHGYVCMRVDRRGCGDSEGIFDDEYSEQEIQDGVDLIDWIAAQDWCDGNVGIQGISWGGFNGVQIAARAPEALKAVITIGTTVDRYNDDIHYKGGIQLGENIGWSATAMSWFSMPPDPALVGDKWRDIWLNRLENAPFQASTWCRHPDRDAYWKHGSICEDYSTIKAAVLVMGGLHDGYRNAMAKMVENLDCPVKGIVGPWSHKYPNISTIGPSIDYLGEALRWWDHWLKGKNTSVDHDPAYRAYVMDSVAPDPSLGHRDGAWVAEPGWPSPNVSYETLSFGDGTLGTPEPFSGVIETNLECGQQTGEFFPFGFGPGELPDDQTKDDALSLCFKSAPSEKDTVLLGAPRLNLTLSSNAQHGQIVVRLCDLRPDGTSNLISLGLLNLRHRNGFEKSESLAPDQELEIQVSLDQTAYNLPAGHQLQIALSNSYWPFCWPDGRSFSLKVTKGALDLPIRDAENVDGWYFDAPVEMEMRPYKELRSGHEAKDQFDDPFTGQMTLKITGDHGARKDMESGLVSNSAVQETWNIVRGDPASANVEIIWDRGMGRGDWNVRTKIVTKMSGEADDFVIEQRIEAYEGDDLVFERILEDRVARYPDSEG